MIKSDAQLERTKAQIQGFRKAIADLKLELPVEAFASVAASHQGMIVKLEAEVQEYEEAKLGIIRLPRLSSPKDLGVHLVRFRIAQGITQDQLAEIVGVTRQTINKHEEQEYQLASVDLISRVCDALGVLSEIHVRHKRLDVSQPMPA